MGLLFGALAGAGGAIADIAKKDQDAASDEKRARMLADLEEQKTLRIEEARAQRQRQAGIAQGSQIASEASRLRGQSDAAAINAKFGSNAAAEDVAALDNNPGARKAYGLPELGRLGSLETRAQAAENLGYLDASRETRGLIQAEIGNLRNEANDKATNRRLDLAEANSARSAARQEALAAAQIAHIKAQTAYQSSQDELLYKKEARSATYDALNGANQDIKGIEKQMSDPMIDENLKGILNIQLSSTRDEAKRLRTALARSGLEGSEKPESKTGFDPAKYQIGGKPVPTTSAGTGDAIASRSQTAMQAAPDSRILGQVIMPSIGAKFPIVQDDNGDKKLDVSGDVILQNLRKTVLSVPSVELKMDIGAAINNRIDQLQQLENEIATKEFRNPLKLTGL